MAGKKSLIPIVVVVVAVGAYFGWRRWRDQANGSRIKLSGNIELTEVKIAFKVPGKLVERPVEEGDRVEKGALIGKLDGEQLRRALARDQAAATAAETLIAQLRTAIELQRSTLAAETEMRRAEIQAAESLVRELETGSRRQEVGQVQAQAEDARTQHEQARKDWERAQILYKNEDISTAQFDQYRTRFLSTRALVAQTEQRFSLVKEGPRQENIESARAQLARARAALKLTEAARLELRRKEQELATRAAELERARAQIRITESQIDDTVAVTPVGGYVLVKSAEVGEVLAAGAPVASIGDLDHPWLRGYINEKDLGRVKLGTAARLKTDSYPGKEYRGRVSFISQEAEFTPKQIQTPEERVKLVYRIKIEVDNPHHELKSNMPVDAELVLDGK